jgi:hypothetical protein
LEQYFHVCGSPANPQTGLILLERESFAAREETSGDDVSQISDPISPASSAIPAVTDCVSDLFALLESKPVWKIEELEEVLDISAKTLYKQAGRGKLPAFRIGSCVRVYGKGLADHLRGKMKK